MYYNILNFPGTSAYRIDSMRQILTYVEPDVYVVNELETAGGADLILNEALNVFGKTNYQRANFINGPDTDNCLFYNTNKVGLISQTQIGTTLRDISMYKLYYKASNLANGADTIYFYFFSCHLKAGASDYQQRNEEAQQLKFYLNSIADEVENVFVGGDFNFYSGFESGCLTLLDVGAVPLYDPIDAIGNWSSDPAYAYLHTQSTRISGGDGSGGGMDDRFDLIFVSEDVLDNSNGVEYITGTYEALGQDGNRYNQTIISPTNFSVPDSVAQALYGLSDHLPVLMTLAIDETASAATYKNEFNFQYTEQDRMVMFQTLKTVTGFTLYNLSGQLVFEAQPENNQLQIPFHLSSGAYIWRAKAEHLISTGKLIVL